LEKTALKQQDKNEQGSGLDSENKLKTLANSALGAQLNEAMNIFTPSTPYVHKFRTEMCKNFELTGKCKYGNEVSLI
jgi:hypothetical protein